MTESQEKQVREKYRTDTGFAKFLEDVHESEEHVAQVWLSEAWQILQLLWKIYQLIQNRNFVVKWYTKLRTRRALLKVGSQQEAALKGILEGI